MRALIYMTVVGRAYERYAQACIASLRGRGGYEGDIQLFTDHRLNLDARQTVIPTESDPVSIAALRITCGLRVDFAKYDRVMYLDVDHLAFGPVAPFFVHEGLRALSEGEPTGGSATHEGWLSEAERREDRGHRFCAGLVCGESGAFERLVWEWDRLYKTPAPAPNVEWYKDQAVLNALAFRGVVRLSPYDDSMVSGVYVRREKKSILYHYWGGEGKKAMIDDWRALCATEAPAAPVATGRPAR